jgi:uncharacterized membrane protein YccC
MRIQEEMSRTGCNARRSPPPPFSFAGIAFGSWAFAFRTWIAIVVALYTGFWLQLDAASSGAVTVAILALPTRGEALEKAGFRLIGTIIGVAVSILMVGLLSQTRDLLLVAFAGWIGLCVYAAGVLDGNRSYAAVLSGYTVGLIAITQLDSPDHVFETGVQRGAAIAVGIGALALVNDLLAAPDRHPLLATQLADLHRRVRSHAKVILQYPADDASTAITLMHEITVLRSEITSLAAESSSGPARGAAARSMAVALIAELHAARLLSVLAAASESAIQDRVISALAPSNGKHPAVAHPFPSGEPIGWALARLQRYDREARDCLSALKEGVPPRRAWRTPFYHCHRIAAEAGVRAAFWLFLPSIFFVVAGWPSTELSLALVPVIIGFGATSPTPRTVTVLALVAMPMATVMAGILEFEVLDGATQFPLLALALAPIAIGASLLVTRSNQTLATLGRMNLIFILVILSPSNPQVYDPQVYLSTSLLLCLPVALLLASQLLVPPLSNQRRRHGLMASARREFAGLARIAHYSPEEAMFRDAARIGQVAATDIGGPQPKAMLGEFLLLFDRAGIIRLCEASLSALVTDPAAGLRRMALQALASRDMRSIRDAAAALRDAGNQDVCVAEAGMALDAAAFILGKPGA